MSCVLVTEAFQRGLSRAEHPKIEKEVAREEMERVANTTCVSRSTAEVEPATATDQEFAPTTSSKSSDSCKGEA